PVVDDVLHQVRVRARRDGVEEAPALNLRASREVARREIAIARRLDDLGLVEEDAAQLAMPLQDGGEQMPVSAADVDQRAQLAKRRAPGDGFVLRARDAGPRRGEDALVLGMLREPLERRDAVHVVEGLLTRAYTVQQIAPGAPVVAFD